MSTVPGATPINLIDPNDLIPSISNERAILLRRFGLFDDTLWEGLGGAVSKNSSRSNERHDKPTETSRTVCDPYAASATTHLRYDFSCC
jgi:hypothetical protein